MRLFVLQKIKNRYKIPAEHTAGIFTAVLAVIIYIIVTNYSIVKSYFSKDNTINSFEKGWLL